MRAIDRELITKGIALESRPFMALMLLCRDEPPPLEGDPRTRRVHEWYAEFYKDPEPG